MKSVELNATLREEVRSKSALKNLRKEGRVPAILYGGKENLNFHLDAIELSKLLSTTEAHLIDLKIGDKTVKSVVREMQFHPVSDDCIHVDFMEVSGKEPITIGVPVRFTGDSIGVMSGGQRREKLRKLILRAIPDNIPEEFVVDVTNLKIGDVIQVEDVHRENVEFLDHPKAVIVSVKSSRVVVEPIVEGEEDDEEGVEGEEGDEETTDAENKEEAAATE